MPLVTVQSFLLSILDGLPLPYGVPNAQAYITPPDPRINGKVPAIFIWPSDGQENRSKQLGGTIPRNTGVNTASGTKGIRHRLDVYVTWFSANAGKRQDPVFPGIVDAIMFALRTSQPNPAYITDPNTGITSTIYNVGEDMNYRIGIDSVAEERTKRYDALVNVTIWEILNA